MSEVSNEVIDKAIAAIESIISVMVKDMAMGASYVRNNSAQCFSMIMLQKELEARKVPAKKKKQFLYRTFDEMMRLYMRAYLIIGNNYE